MGQWPKTTASVASILTATYPKDNGIVRRVGQHLPGEFRTLAEVIRSHGYRTGAVVSNGALGKELRFDQVFETYLQTWTAEEEPLPEGVDENRAEVVNRLAVSMVDEWSADEPFFLWLHYLDPPTTYWPPENQFLFLDQELSEKEAIRLRDWEHDGPRDVVALTALYDAEVHYVDDRIGKLLATLQERGFLENTIVIVTADHGESLGEHGYYYNHGKLGFENTLRVPLVFVWSEQISAKVTEWSRRMAPMVPA